MVDAIGQFDWLWGAQMKQDSGCVREGSQTHCRRPPSLVGELLPILGDRREPRAEAGGVHPTSFCLLVPGSSPCSWIRIRHHSLLRRPGTAVTPPPSPGRDGGPWPA
jgi:hypothetical protein